MSQQIMTIVSAILKALKVYDVGDIEYMAKKSFDGKTVTEQGVRTFGAGPGQLVAITADPLKDLYLAKAKIAARVDSTNGNLNAIVELRANGVPVETFVFFGSIASGFSGSDSAEGYEFAISGIKVLATQTIELFATSLSGTSSGGRITGVLECWQEDSNEDPTLIAQNVSVDADVSGAVADLGFIQEKVLAGDYFQVSGDINNLNETIEYIVPAGRRAFLIEAKIVITTHISPPANPVPGNAIVSDRVRAALQFVTGVGPPVVTVKDTTNIGVVVSQSSGASTIGDPVSGGGTGSGNLGDGKFNVLGLSLVGDGVNTKIQIENTLDAGSAFATMSGYLV